MDITNILLLFGGLGMFLFGMRIMGQGLEKIAGGKFERMLEHMTDRPVKGMLLGLLVTAVIQSSSATTVMVVGFVNSGLMQLGNAIGVIMGANIGTTVTAWILSLAGIESTNVIVSLFRPESLAAILSVIGILLLTVSKRSRTRDIGGIFLGFTILMVGMSQISSSVQPLADMPAFTRILTLFSNPILGVLTGAVLTGIIQSSSASVGILQALALTGQVTLGTAIPIIMGQNIGTCVTALLSCVGATKNAKRAAMVHLYFNLIGTVLFLVLYYVLDSIFGFSFAMQAATPLSIAIVHTVFNVFSTAVMLPAWRLLEKLAILTVPDGKQSGAAVQPPLLEERLLSTPGVAVEQCRSVTTRMAEYARDAIEDSLACIRHYHVDTAKRIVAREAQIDEYEDALSVYMVRLSGKELSQTDSRRVGMLLHTIGDLERIGDHAMNLCETAHEMHEKEIAFSREAARESGVLMDALSEIVDLAVRALIDDDAELARLVEPLEEVIDMLKDEVRSRHISRLQEGACTVELGFIFSDFLTNVERASDHCSNIAAAIIENHAGRALPAHHYLNELKAEPDPVFSRAFDAYREKYAV